MDILGPQGRQGLSNSLNSVTFEIIFVAVGSSGDIVTSSDGSSWTAYTSDGVFYDVTTNTNFNYSIDLIAPVVSISLMTIKQIFQLTQIFHNIF